MNVYRLQVLRGHLFTTVAVVAELLESDPRTVRRAIEAGQIPAVRAGPSTVRIPVVPFLRQVVGLSDAQIETFISEPRNEAPDSADADSSPEPAPAKILDFKESNRDQSEPSSA